MFKLVNKAYFFIKLHFNFKGFDLFLYKDDFYS